MQVLDSTIEEIQDDLNHQEEQMKYLENQSRRNNVRIDTILEEDNETWETTEAKARQVLKDELNSPELLMLRERIAWVKVHVGQLRPRVVQIVLELLFVAFVTGKRGKRS